MKIAVCEDTDSDKIQLLALLAETEPDALCEVFCCAEDFLAAYAPQKYDLLLTDIYMGGMTGVELVSRLRETDESLPVAFVTTSTEHALESYRLSALKYIEKPFRKKDIEDILKLARLERDSAPTLTVLSGSRELRIRFARILYIEQQSHRLHIHLSDGSEVQLYEKLQTLLPELEEQHFFSPHKSYAVNLAAVCSVDPELRCFVMQDGTNVPIRRESMSTAKKVLAEFLFRRTREV